MKSKLCKILLIVITLYQTIHAFHFSPICLKTSLPARIRLEALPESANIIEASIHQNDVILANWNHFFDYLNIYSLFDLVPGKQDNFINQIYDPSKFQPVCPASDAVYQVTKAVSNNLIGQENVAEYGPLIASVLLRARLELCVVESFIYEAVIPFIQQRGLSWVRSQFCRIIDSC